MSTVTVFDLMQKPSLQEFERFFEEYYDLVYRTAYSITGSWQDAEDVLQTIFVRLLDREHPVDFTRGPGAYLYRAAVNVSLNIVKTRKRQNVTDDVDTLEIPAPTPTVDDEMRRALLDAIAQLNPKAVEILILHYEHNYSDAQIAKMLGTSRGTIAVTLFRTRARLKKLLRRTE